MSLTATSQMSGTFFIKDVNFMYVAAILFWGLGIVAVMASLCTPPPKKEQIRNTTLWWVNRRKKLKQQEEERNGSFSTTVFKMVLLLKKLPKNAQTSGTASRSVIQLRNQASVMQAWPDTRKLTYSRTAINQRHWMANLKEQKWEEWLTARR